MYLRISSASRSTSSMRRLTTSPIDTIPDQAAVPLDGQVAEASAGHHAHDLVDGVVLVAELDVGGHGFGYRALQPFRPLLADDANGCRVPTGCRRCGLLARSPPTAPMRC